MVSRTESVRIVSRSKDLLLGPPPRWVIDAVNVVLGLEHDAAVLGDGAREVLVVEDALRLLEGQNTAGGAARVHLERILVTVHVDGDA